MCSRQGQQGFTLIEILIAVAIVGILAAVAIPSYQSSVNRSIVRTAQSDLVSLAAAITNIRQRTLAYPNVPADADPRAAGQPFNGTSVWAPASNANDFTFLMRTDTANNTFVVTATSAAPAGSALAGCVLTLTESGVRQVANCPEIGNAWL